MSLITWIREWGDQELADRWLIIICIAIGAVGMLAVLLWLDIALDWLDSTPNPILDAA